VEGSDAGEEKARLSKVAIWEADWETTGSEGTSSFVLGDEVAGKLGGMHASSQSDGRMGVSSTDSVGDPNSQPESSRKATFPSRGGRPSLNYGGSDEAS
jgi:hypothetical protein